jgi:diguanylate cyclase (GGDEF)-like protein/PAS domain S-box-containing protein
MLRVFGQQIDYILFIAGFGFLVTGLLSCRLRKRKIRQSAWGWLAAFGFAEAVGKAQAIYNLYNGAADSDGFDRVLMACSSAFLLMTVLSGERIKGRSRVVWLSVPAVYAVTEIFSFGQLPGTFHLIIPGVLAGVLVFVLSYVDWMRRRGAEDGIPIHLAFLGLAYSVSCIFFHDQSAGENLTYEMTQACLALFGASFLWNHLKTILAEQVFRGIPSRVAVSAIVTVFGILTTGWLAAIYEGNHAIGQLNKQLVARTITATAAINTDLIMSLSASPEDTSNPDFESIRHQLQVIRVVNPDCRYVRLLRPVGHRVLHMADAESDYSSRHVQPGTCVDDTVIDSKPNLLRGISFAREYDEEKMGRIMSGFAPIRNPESNDVIAFLRFDVDPLAWEQTVAQYRLFIILITGLLCGSAIMLFATMIKEFVARTEESERRYKNLVEAYPNWVTLFDCTGRIVEINGIGLQQVGMEANELVGSTFVSIWPDSAREAVSKAVENTLKGEYATFEAEYGDPLGNTSHFYVILSPLASEDGYSGRFISISIDITDRKRTEELLQMQSSAINAAKDMIMITDKAARIEFVNPAFEQETGYSLQEVLGCTPGFLRSGVHDASFYKNIQSAVLEGRAWHGEITNVCKDGDLCTEDMTITPVKDESGATAHFIAIKRNITEKKLYEKRLDHLAHHDPLTGLPNRLLFADRLTQKLASARRTKTKLAVMFLDLDRFKNINDTLGHNVGDGLLKEVSKRLTSNLREADTVSRMGGDEFIIILSELETMDDVHSFAGKVLDEFKHSFNVDDREFFVSCSVGISMFPSDGDNVETLVRNADTAMYRAKEQGRNNYQFYTESLNEAALERMVLENSIRRALDRNEFTLHYQPKVDIASGRMLGTEALIRWCSPEHGYVSPSRFIPIAEETGLIIPITEWVLKTACRQNKAWQDAGYPPIDVGVNISAKQFQQGKVIETVMSVLDETGLLPQYLDLEITEGTLMHNLEVATSTLEQLRKMGVHISIDDFGTGYSSLSYLTRFPVNTVKIDQSFVKDIILKPDDAAIAGAVVAMAHSLKLRVIAEGVETIEQLKFLENLRCDEIQGYFVSRPIPAGELESFLSTDGVEGLQAA